MKNRYRRPLRHVSPFVLFCFSLVLVACGGSGGNTPESNFTIGGTVSGLTGTGLVLQNNGSDGLAIMADGGFTFSTPLNDLSTYSVTVSTEPSTPNQTCLVTNATGALAGANITDVSITCTTKTYTVGGTVSGLSGSGLILQNNGSDDLPIAADGDFTFSTSLNDLSAFAVTASIAPSVPNQSCSITNGSGNLAGANIKNISVICTNVYSIGGTVSGLTGTGLILQNNGGDDLPIAADGSFTFLTPLNDLSAFAVTASTAPSAPNQSCSVTNGSGNLAGANITNVSVICTNTYTIGGTVSGLTGTGLILQNNGGDDLPIAADGSFTFSTPLNDLSAFAVTISTTPSAPNQSCSITNDSGNLAGANIKNVSVMCITTLHVSVGDPNANDTSTGTQAVPFLTITAAIAYANSLSLTAEVRVAEGNYDVNSRAGTQVVMVEGISLYGGYSSDWSTRDPDNNPTVITDRATVIPANQTVNTVYAGSSITTATVIDGFNIIGGAEISSRAVRVDGGSLTISNNILQGGGGVISVGLSIGGGEPSIVTNNTINGGGGTFSTGIFTGASSPIITNNTIDGGNGIENSTGISIRTFGPTIANNNINGGNGGQLSTGIETDGASTVIINNTIDGGLGGLQSYGIDVSGASAPTITNNTIDGGRGSDISVGIDNGNNNINPATTINNNIVFTSSGNSRICIREGLLESDPSSVRNNNLFDCPTAMYVDNDSGVNITNITAMEVDLTAEGTATGGNTSNDPNFSNRTAGNWHLTSTSPCSVTQGGIDGLTEGWSFTDDNEGNPRTNDGLSAGWSMGAYEFDGTCEP